MLALKRMQKRLMTLALSAAITFSTNAGEPYNVPPAETNKVSYDPRNKSEMDDLTSDEDVARFAASAKSDAVVFTEDRSNSIRWSKSLPKRWLNTAIFYHRLALKKQHSGIDRTN